jgi:hypothetical protein
MMAAPRGRPEFNQINVAFNYPIAKSSLDDPLKHATARKRDRQQFGIGPVVVGGSAWSCSFWLSMVSQPSE